MSRVSMSEMDLRNFLSLPLIADIATLKKEGSPQMTPVWYDFDGTYLYISTTTDRAKARNIKRDKRVAVSIRNENAHKVVLLAGIVEILDDKDHNLVRKIAARYMPTNQLDGFVGSLEANRVILRVKPIKTISWNF